MDESLNEPKIEERRHGRRREQPASSEVITRTLTEMSSPALGSGEFKLSDARAGVSIGHFMEVVRRYRWPIILTMLISLIGTALVTARIKPLYESTVEINVERRGNGGFIGQQASMPSVGYDMDQILTTQVELIQSDPVLRPTAEKYKLLELERQFRGLNAQEAERLRKAPTRLKRLKVARVPNTYILRITYTATDPQLAADVANAIAQSYVEHAFDSRNRSYVQVSEVIETQLKDLRAKMISSGQALADSGKQLNLIDPEQRINILSSRLLQLNTDYTNAQSERLKKEAVFNQSRSGTLASAQVSSQGETLEKVRERLNIAKQQFATVKTVYGENNPEYQKSQNEVTELENQAKDLQNNTLDRVGVDYQQALAREEMARRLVSQTKREVDKLNNQAFDYARLKSEAENYNKLYDDLQRVTREEDINRSFQDAVIQIEVGARPAAKQSSPSMKLNLLLTLILSGLLGISGTLIYDMMDTKLRGPEQAAKLLNVDVIATLPKTKKITALPGRRRLAGQGVSTIPQTRRTRLLMEYQESIRGLRNTIGMIALHGAFRSLVVTSATAGEGKSTIAANLAFSYALLGKKVLIIDADIRRPSLHEFFEKPMNAGLSNVLQRNADWKEILLKVAAEQLYLLPAGEMSENLGDFVATGMKELLEEAYKLYDVVIVDGPPLLGVPESVQVAALADAVLVIARARSTSAKNVSAAYASLTRARANVIGLVMNDVEGADPYSHYGANPAGKNQGPSAKIA